jgi:hypothetical protein
LGPAIYLFIHLFILIVWSCTSDSGQCPARTGQRTLQTFRVDEQRWACPKASVCELLDSLYAKTLRSLRSSSEKEREREKSLKDKVEALFANPCTLFFPSFPCLVPLAPDIPIISTELCNNFLLT